MSDWKQAGENLVRHRAGNYYLRAKVAGKIIRRSLKTSDLRIAKIKRDELLTTLRAAGEEEKIDTVRTLGDALAILEQRTVLPHLKESTRTDYKQTYTALRSVLPLKLHGRVWSEQQARQAWSALTAKLGARRANKALLRLQQMVQVLIEHGVRTSDPTVHLRRMKAQVNAPDMPSPEQIEALIQNVRDQRKRLSEESANFIACIAFAGLRISEARRLTWKDIDDQWIRVTNGEKGTKNMRERMVPICPPMSDLLAEMRKQSDSGPLFSIVSPRFALEGACKRLGLPRLTPHKLRHWFATWAMERGVDVRTAAGWLGHTDNGVLLLKTYSHLRAAHSLDQAKLLG